MIALNPVGRTLGQSPGAVDLSILPARRHVYLGTLYGPGDTWEGTGPRPTEVTCKVHDVPIVRVRVGE